MYLILLFYYYHTCTVYVMNVKHAATLEIPENNIIFI